MFEEQYLKNCFITDWWILRMLNNAVNDVIYSVFWRGQKILIAFELIEPWYRCLRISHYFCSFMMGKKYKQGHKTNSKFFINLNFPTYNLFSFFHNFHDSLLPNLIGVGSGYAVTKLRDSQTMSLSSSLRCSIRLLRWKVKFQSNFFHPHLGTPVSTGPTRHLCLPNTWIKRDFSRNRMRKY